MGKVGAGLVVAVAGALIALFGPRLLESEATGVVAVEEVGVNPAGMALMREWTGQDWIWVANEGRDSEDDTLSLVHADRTRRYVTRHFSVGDSPSGIVVQFGSVWFVDCAPPVEERRCPTAYLKAFRLPSAPTSVADPAWAPDIEVVGEVGRVEPGATGEALPGAVGAEDTGVPGVESGERYIWVTNIGTKEVFRYAVPAAADPLTSGTLTSLPSPAHDTFAAPVTDVQSVPNGVWFAGGWKPGTRLQTLDPDADTGHYLKVWYLDRRGTEGVEDDRRSDVPLCLGQPRHWLEYDAEHDDLWVASEQGGTLYRVSGTRFGGELRGAERGDSWRLNESDDARVLRVQISGHPGRPAIGAGGFLWIPISSGYVAKLAPPEVELGGEQGRATLVYAARTGGRPTSVVIGSDNSTVWALVRSSNPFGRGHVAQIDSSDAPPHDQDSWAAGLGGRDVLVSRLPDPPTATCTR